MIPQHLQTVQLLQVVWSHDVVWSRWLTEPCRMNDETDDMDCGGVQGSLLDQHS